MIQATGVANGSDGLQQRILPGADIGMIAADMQAQIRTTQATLKFLIELESDVADRYGYTAEFKVRQGNLRSEIVTAEKELITLRNRYIALIKELIETRNVEQGPLMSKAA